MRLVGHSGNANVISVMRLVHDYPSHDFIIDFEEANELFNKVDCPQECLYDVIQLLGDAMYDEATPAVVTVLRQIDVKGSEDEREHEGDEAEAAGDPAEASVDNGGGADRGRDNEAAERVSTGGETEQPSSSSNEEAPGSAPAGILVSEC